MIASASAAERPALQYGIYDPEERFAKSDQIGVEHIFVQWESNYIGRLRSASDYAASRNRWLMVTVEPWPAHSRTGETLLTDITDGIYDSDLANIGSVLGELNRPVFVRWGHEMEDLTGRYPWASRDAEAYISSTAAGFGRTGVSISFGHQKESRVCPLIILATNMSITSACLSMG